jgi:hypothetical protein
VANWIILRTDTRKEAFVARQIAQMGYQAWVPIQIIASRPSAARRVTAKAHLTSIKELPILPRRVFARIVDYLDRETQSEIQSIRYFDAFERDAEQRFALVPDDQIAAFRAVIEAENTASLALSQRASRKQKAKWKSLHGALVEMIEGAKAQLEQAA